MHFSWDNIRKEIQEACGFEAWEVCVRVWHPTRDVRHCLWGGVRQSPQVHCEPAASCGKFHSVQKDDDYQEQAAQPRSYLAHEGTVRRSWWGIRGAFSKGKRGSRISLSHSWELSFGREKEVIVKWTVYSSGHLAIALATDIAIAWGRVEII